jgi:MFS family permease
LTTPAGALVDATHYKRTLVIAASLCSMAASVAVLISQTFWVVTASQIGTAVAGATIAPAVVGITLGIVGQRGFNRQNGRNQAFNHAGNMIGAALSGYAGWQFGLDAVFVLAPVFALLAIASVLTVSPDAIDHHQARGQADDNERHAGSISGLGILIECKPLLVLAIALALFHLGNAAMLPLFGLAVVAAKQGDPAEMVALTVVIAQGVMIVASLVAMRMAESGSYWLVILVSFIALPVRAVVAAAFITDLGVFPVQILDGIGAGLQSVAVPGMVAYVMNRTGRVNLGQGVVMTMQGVGAALSPALGGWAAQLGGYRFAFLLLGLFSLIALALWIAFARMLKGADVPARSAGN